MPPRPSAEQNVQLVMRTLAHFTTGDLEGAVPLWHDDALVTAPEGWPETGPFEGGDAIMRQFERLAADYHEQRFEDVETLAATDEWVVMGLSWVTRGSASGIETRFRFAAAYRVAGERFAEAHFRWDPGEALRVAGLDG